MKAPTLKTVNLTLSAPVVYKGMDMSHYLRWLSDLTVTRYSEQRHLKHSKDTQFKFMSGFMESPDYYWDINLNDNPIGSLTATCDWNNMVANVGILIGDLRYWGRGFACESYEAVIEFLFGEGFRKIEVGTMAANGQMIHVLHKLGFVQEAVIKDHYLLNGQPQDLYCYAKFRKAKVVAFKDPRKESTDPV